MSKTLTLCDLIAISIAPSTLVEDVLPDVFNPDDPEVQEVVDAYRRLGWGGGVGGCSSPDWSIRNYDLRFVRRGRWYSLEKAKIRQMAIKAAKAEKIMAYFRRIFSLDGVPNHLLPFCLDMSKHIRVDEDLFLIFLSLGPSKSFAKGFPMTPQGAYQARKALEEKAKAYLAAA